MLTFLPAAIKCVLVFCFSSFCSPCLLCDDAPQVGDKAIHEPTIILTTSRTLDVFEHVPFVGRHVGRGGGCRAVLLFASTCGEGEHLENLKGLKRPQKSAVFFQHFFRLNEDPIVDSICKSISPPPTHLLRFSDGPPKPRLLWASRRGSGSVP